MIRNSFFKRLPKAKSVAAATALMLVLSIGFTGLFSLTSELTLANHSQCSDGLDNDSDGRTDYPQDDDCQNLDDDFEGIGLSGNFITVTDGHDKVSQGQAVVYVITLKQQRDTARNVNVSFHLPHQANVVSASDGGAVIDNSTVRWTNVSIYKNVTRTLTVNVNIDPDAPVGQYLVARTLVEGAEATDTSLVENYSPQSQDGFRISVTDGREFVLPETNLTYTARVRNTTSQSVTTDVRAAMPYTSSFLSSSPGGVRDSYNVTWKKQSFAPGEEKIYSYTVQVDRDAVDRTVIRSRVYAGTVNGLDETVVRIGLPYGAVTASITDNRNTAEIGQILTYVIKVKNDSDVVATQVAVDANMPTYGEFVSATEGGISDGNNVRWLIVQIAPHDVRTLSYSVRVRSDAPLDSILTAGAVADGANGHHVLDKTKVVLESNEVGLVAKSVLFRKSADRSEAVPGGKIRYTLFIRNTLDTVISDATILDRYDNRYLSLESADNRQFLIENEEGRMVWKVPVLKPGESWSTTYVLSVSADAPTGLPLDNVATLRGHDVSGVSLTERVSTNTSGVLGDFPETGAGMDAILALLLAVPAFAAAGVQRKLGFSL